METGFPTGQIHYLSTSAILNQGKADPSMKKILKYLFVILFIIILAYLFVPDKEYTSKVWVLKGISLAQPYQAAVIEYWRRTGALPMPGDLAHEKILVKVDFDKTAVKSITIGEEGPGTVTVHYFTTGIDSAPAAIDNRTITLTPGLADNKLAWTCQGTMPDEFIPRRCK